MASTIIVESMSIEEILELFVKDWKKTIFQRMMKESKVYGKKEKTKRPTSRKFFPRIEFVTPAGFHVVLQYYLRAKTEPQKYNIGTLFYCWFRWQGITALKIDELEGVEAVRNVYTDHFFDRYRERFVKNERLEKTEVIYRFMSNNQTCIGRSDPSEKYPKSAYLNFRDGLCLCDIEEENIIIFRTFVSRELMHQNQIADDIVARRFLANVKNLDLAIPEDEFDSDNYRGKKKGLNITAGSFDSLIDLKYEDMVKEYAEGQFHIAQVKHYSGNPNLGIDEAVKNYTRSAELGNQEAQHALGVCYHRGEGVSRNYEKAFYWFTKAAEQGYAHSQYNVGCYYGNGIYVEKNLDEAVKCFLKAAESGSLQAQLTIAQMYYHGYGLPKNLEESIRWYQKAGLQGDINAQFTLGIWFHDGIGVKQDYPTAAKWFSSAAIQNHVGSQYALGIMHENGNGVEKDYAKAAEWMRKAAVQGLAAAQYELGSFYTNGHGVQKNETIAAEWYLKAAEQGHQHAQTNLGAFYMRGLGVPKNQQKAEYWLRKSAYGDNNLAMLNLGHLLFETNRYQEAEQWARKAVTIQRNDDSLCLLARTLIKQGKVEEATEVISQMKNI